MKKMLMCILLIAMTLPIMATDIMVQPGENTIKAALATAAAGDRLILEQEGVYANDPLFIYVPLTIKAAEGLASKPVISFLWNADTAVAQTQEATQFFTYASLTIADIELTMDGEPEAKTTRMFRNRADIGVNWKFYNTDMHHAHQLTMSITGVPDTLILADGSMVFDGIDYVDNAGVFIDGVQVATDGLPGVLDTLIFDGCYIYDLDGTGGRKINHSANNRGLRNLFQFTNSSIWNTTNSAIFLKMQDPDGISDGKVVIDHSTFDHIGIPGENHDGFVVKFAATDSYVNNTTFTNVADEPCKTTGGTTTSAVAVDYCNWYNNGAAGDTPVGGTHGANNIQVDPLFVDSAIGDLTLQAGSPLIGAGEGGSSIGDPRWAPAVTPGNPVTFSVDMSFQTTLGTFVPGTDVLDVAGTLNEWGGGDMLTDGDADGIYEGTFSVPAGPMEYKFRINSNWDTSEGIDNRMYTVVAGENILPTVWYGNQEPVGTADVEVFIQADMTVQLLNGNFDPGNGDLIVIRGGHDNYGNWGGAIQMTLDPEQTNVYTHLSSFDAVPIGSGFEYKFVILTGGDVDQAIWEGSPNRSFTATGDETDSDENGYGEIFQAVAYFADVTPDDIITQDVSVTFNLDISSAYRALDAGDTLIDTQTGSDDITMWSEVNGVTINGILSQWWDWGNDVTCVGEWAMTQTDTEGLKYTYSYLYTAGQAKAQQCKYGINSLDNESGFAQNRDFMIDDAAATFVLDEHCFGEHNTDTNLPFPQSCEPLSVASLPGIPTSYALSQNYPNPFNPNTEIGFSMAESGYAVLTVYNALGQEVKTLSSSYLSGGNYTVSWDATNDLGQHVPSGVYLYTLSANGSSVSKKMVLMK